MYFNLNNITAALGHYADRYKIEIISECESTSSVLLNKVPGAASGTVLVAENQSSGRGRRGKKWLSSMRSSLTFSMIWSFSPRLALTGLSLATGVAVVRAVRAACPDISDLSLKWPNDILKEGSKLAGILVELVPDNPHIAVIGIGVNVGSLPKLQQETLANGATLENCCAPEKLLAAILSELAYTMNIFAEQGFSPLRESWRSLHYFENAMVQITDEHNPPRSGICRGVDYDGALLLEANGNIERVISGNLGDTISLRSDSECSSKLFSK